MDRFKPASQSRAERPTNTKCNREQRRVTGKCAIIQRGQRARNSPVGRLTHLPQRPMSSRFLRNFADSPSRQWEVSFGDPLLVKGVKSCPYHATLTIYPRVILCL